MNSSGMCEGKCSILSVSGTPLHSATPTLGHTHTPADDNPSWELYGPLISCLNTEHRKAGGYFQQHLESIDEKVLPVYVCSIICTVCVGLSLLSSVLETSPRLQGSLYWRIV